MATAEFSKFAGILSAALLQHHLLGFEITSNGISLVSIFPDMSMATLAVERKKEELSFYSFPFLRSKKRNKTVSKA